MKKLYVAVILAFGALFGLKVLLDIVAPLEEKASSDEAVLSTREAASELAPNVYYYRVDPYMKENPVTHRNGYFIDIVRAVFPRAKFIREGSCAADYVKLLEQDPMGVVIGYGDHPLLKAFPAAKTPVGWMHVYLFTRRDCKWRYDGTETLDNVRIGIDSDYLDSKVISGLIAKWKSDPSHVRVYQATKEDRKPVFRAIEKGEIEAYAGISPDVYHAQETSSREVISNYRRSEPIDKTYMRFRVSNKDSALAEALIEAWEKGRERCERSGELKRIRQYYNFDR